VKFSLTSVAAAAGSLFDFMRPNNDGVVTDGSLIPDNDALPEGPKSPAAVAVYDEQAVSQLMRMLTKMPDLDEVLRQAGVPRSKLRVLLTDDEIAQACETRLDALLSVPMRLEPSEGGNATSLMEILDKVRVDAIAGIFMARLFGYSVLEAVYEKREDGKIGFKFLGEKPMEWFEPRADGDLRYYPDDGSSSGYGITVDQRYKFFLTRSRASYRQPYGEALLSRLYWPWYFRTNGWKFWAKFLERFGSPLLVGQSSDPKAMVAALLTAHSQAVMGVGRDDSVNAVGPASGNNGQVFDLFESAAIRRIQKVILGQTMTSGTDGGSGNRALGQVHDNVRTDKRNSDIVMATQTMQRIADAVCELNGWPKHQIIFADDVGLETERAERDSKLYTQGVRFTEGYYQDQYDLNPTDFTLTSEADPATLPPGAPGAGPAAKPGTKANAASGAGKPAGSTKASQGRSGLFSRLVDGERRFTANQEDVEDLGDAALDTEAQPLDPDAVRAAIMMATDPDDLEQRLFALVGDKLAEGEFAEVLEASLFAADVLGYVHAEGK
jgi:phage gp29-like protein